MIKLDVVIVNWNAGAQLLNCLESLSVSWQRSIFELSQCTVVDNASSDKSADVQGKMPFSLSILKNPENKGFASACNQGAAEGSSEYILFLNPDVKLFKDSLSRALLFLNEPKNKQIGILGIQLVNENGRVHRNTARLPTPVSLFYEMLGLDHLCPSRFPPRIMTDWDHQENIEVDHVEGAFFLVRRSIFEELSGFDERFFLYFEDVDFSYRAKQAGWKSYYLADIQAFHCGGGTTDRIKAKRLYYWFNSRLQYVAKHFGQLAVWGILISSFCVEFWTRIFINIIKLNWQHLIETIQAYGMYARMLLQLLRDLKNVKTRKHPSEVL